MALEWNPTQLTILRSMWAAKATGLEIGAELGTSRSAVLGKLRRLGLVRGSKPKPPPMIFTRDRSRVARRKPKPPAETLRPGPVTMEHLAAKHCRWIEGSPTPDPLYCGVAQQYGSPYCPKHTAQSFAKGARFAA